MKTPVFKSDLRFSKKDCLLNVYLICRQAISCNQGSRRGTVKLYCIPQLKFIDPPVRSQTPFPL